jgi:hypothetical protein
MLATVAVCVLVFCACIARESDARQVHGWDASLPKPHSTFELGHHPRQRHPLHKQLQAHQNPYSRYSSAHSRGLAATPEILPLYPGYGTHFAYIYVGTPPQRQSVIIDTGSHYTAFPCVGCAQCGQHTDSYWDPNNSTTKDIPSCNNAKCPITQSYSEGSSWHAYKVKDTLWVGGLTATEVPYAETLSVNFTFGCQTSEAGLFRTQLADGIMGFSMTTDRSTLPYVLVDNNLATSTMFALCFRVGGGIMTVGGVDQHIHLKGGTIQYTNMSSNNGWYAVELQDVLFRKQNGESETPESLGGTTAQLCGGKGCIIDSGTTDTYLPASLSKKFSDKFLEMTGVRYSSGNVALSQQQLNKIPNLLFLFRGTDGTSNIVEMPWTSYVDSVGGGKYAFRIYLSESSGTVLGANFMNGHNIIFDIDAKQIGFARSNCKYEDFALTSFPTTQPTKSPVFGDDDDDNQPVSPPCKASAINECSARCDPGQGPHKATGKQTYIDKCNGGANLTDVECTVPCLGAKLSRMNPFCTDGRWSECRKTCQQSKEARAPPAAQSRRLQHGHVAGHSGPRRLDASSNTDSSCVAKNISRSCYTGACPIKDGDYLILLDMTMRIDPMQWSYVHEEDFFRAFQKLFKVSNIMQILQLVYFSF